MSTLDLDGLQRLLWGFAAHRAITVAGRTGVLYALAEEPRTTAAVAEKLGLDPLATDKLIRALAALGLAAVDGDRFHAADGLRAHFTPGDRDIVPFLEHSHALYDRWGQTLEPWLRGEDWPVTERTAEERRRFGAAMRAMGSQIAERVAEVLDLEGVARMLDVGGGWGHYAQAMCRRSPDLRASVLDTPQVVEQARPAIGDTAIAERIDFLPGDYHETDYGSGWDLVLFANVLHQERSEAAIDMVRRGAAALAAGGRVAVVDFAIDDRRSGHVLGTLFAINMRSFGNTWTEPEIRGWMTGAGLADLERIDIGPDRWVIVGRKPR
jgi:cyclopropane fatty-acyl-phospholipid synthase-like methyltransferase